MLVVCHVSHSKKSIPFSQTLRLNRICSENTFFDKRCNELEIWLKERGYSDKLVRGQIRKARKFETNKSEWEIRVELFLILLIIQCF